MNAAPQTKDDAFVIERQVGDVLFRRATMDDGEEIGRLLTMMRDENWPSVSIDREKSRKWITWNIEREIVIIAIKGGVIIATTSLVMRSWNFSRDQYISDGWTFIHPDYRYARVIFKLFEMMREVSDHLGIPLFIGVLTTKDPEGKSKLFRRFFKTVGENFVYNFPGVS